MAALHVAEGEPDQPLPVARRLRAAPAFAPAFEQILDVAALRGGEERETVEQRMPVRNAGEDLDHAGGDGGAHPDKRPGQILGLQDGLYEGVRGQAGLAE